MYQPDARKQDNPLLEQSFRFALAVMAYCDKLILLRKFDMSRQLFKSATSIHAQVREAQYPESNADFIHKLKIGLKEASESEGWLLLCKYAEGYPEADQLLNQLTPIQKMLGSSIATAKRKSNPALRFFGFLIGLIS